MKMKSMMQKMYLELFPKSSLALPSAQPGASDLMPLPEQLDSFMPLPEQLEPTDHNSGFADGNPGFHLDNNW